MREKSETLAYAAVVLAGALACKGVGDSDSGTSKGTGLPSTAPVVVSAQQLHADYHKNEVAADDKYKGKLVRVSGTVQSIDKDAFGSMIVRLATGNQFEAVMATMQDGAKTKVASMAKGQAVTLNCEGAGAVIGSPSLRDCLVF